MQTYSNEERGNYYAETLFLIASGGSIVYHARFMREKSSIVVFFADLVVILIFNDKI